MKSRTNIEMFSWATCLGNLLQQGLYLIPKGPFQPQQFCDPVKSHWINSLLQRKFIESSVECYWGVLQWYGDGEVTVEEQSHYHNCAPGDIYKDEQCTISKYILSMPQSKYFLLIHQLCQVALIIHILSWNSCYGRNSELEKVRYDSAILLVFK